MTAKRNAIPTFYLSVLVLDLLASCAVAVVAPCRLGNIGDTCRSDEDCSGELTQCINGVCSCSNDFEIFNVDEKTKECRPAPSVINALCQSKCKPPLVCSNGRCICWNAKIVGDTCVVECPLGQILIGQECKRVAPIGGLCGSNDDCTAAFSECKQQRCSCVPGTVLRGSNCVAPCPDGSFPTQNCRKILQSVLDASNNVQKMDTCPMGQMCMTYGKPLTGRCCTVFCPFGEADLSKSCSRGTHLNNRCPELTTHFCHQMDTHLNSIKLCCPKPCREPTSFFHNGRCLPTSHWADPCLLNEQCEGGRRMHCLEGRCVCNSGFEMVNETFPTCRRRCPLGAIEVAGECYKKVRLEETCFADEQCPRNARCREGRCECNCQFKSGMKACVNPDDPLNIDGFLKGFQNIFIG